MTFAARVVRTGSRLGAEITAGKGARPGISLMIGVTNRHHPSPRKTGKPGTILVYLDDSRQLTNAVAFIRPAGQLPPWTPRAPAAGAPPPRRLGRPTDARHCTQPYDSIPAVPPVRLVCLTKSSL